MHKSVAKVALHWLCQHYKLRILQWWVNFVRHAEEQGSWLPTEGRVVQAEVPAVGSRAGGHGQGLPGIEHHIVAQTVVDIEPDSWVLQG